MFTEDLTVFFDDDDFAESATCAGSTANVIRDREYLATQGIVAGANPIVMAKASDFGTSIVGTTITVSGTSWTIRSREPMDDGSVVVLQLEE